MMYGVGFAVSEQIHWSQWIQSCEKYCRIGITPLKLNRELETLRASLKSLIENYILVLTIYRMVKKAILERLSFSIKFYRVFRVISMKLGISISIIYVLFLLNPPGFSRRICSFLFSMHLILEELGVSFVCFKNTHKKSAVIKFKVISKDLK